MTPLPQGAPPPERARVAVFCGGSAGAGLPYLEAARALGQSLGRRGLGVVYGGASVGLMGALADGALGVGGEVIGVLPWLLDRREVAHRGLTQLHLVSSMPERKALMASLSSGFLALPGGYGTLDEIFEAVTWTQIAFHDKPCVLINVRGYYDQLLAFLGTAEREGLLKPEYRPMLRSAPDAEAAIELLVRHPSFGLGSAALPAPPG